MTIKDYTEYKEAEILRLYAEVGWTAYTDAPDTLRKGFENSLLTLAGLIIAGEVVKDLAKR